MSRIIAKTNTSVIAVGICLLGCGAAAASISLGDDDITVNQPTAKISVVDAPAAKATGTADSKVVFSSVTVPQPAAVSLLADDARTRAGVNISGGEFGKTPGRIGYDYGYPNSTEINYYKAQGFKIVRIPFKWERLQPELFGALSNADRTALKNAVDYAVASDMVVVLDMHDYAARRPSPSAATRISVGTKDVPFAALTDAWSKIMADYTNDRGKVWVGLMNEPNGLPGADWWAGIQQVVNDLRKQSIKNKMLVPGVSWTGAHSWIKSGNAAFAEQFRDPLNNFAFEVHQYLDSGSSGTSPNCTPQSNQRVDAVLSWAERRNVKLFFGEMGAGPNDVCRTEYTAMLGKLNASPATIGWAAWGGGKWWNQTYMFRLAPLDGNPTPHMRMLTDNLPRR